MHIRAVSLLALLILSPSIYAQRKIVIGGQNDYEQLNATIKSELEDHDGDIEIVFLPGTYYYSNNHIQLGGYNKPNCRLIIKAEGAKIISGGRWHRSGENYSGRFNEDNAFITREGRLLPIWSPIKIADGKVEVLDETTKLCRVKCPGVKDVEEKACANLRIRIPHWFMMSTWVIDKISDGYIYFTVRDLRKMMPSGWYMNDDCNYAQVPNVRYSLCNDVARPGRLSIVEGSVCLPEGVEEVYECVARQFMTIKDCVFKEVLISGLNVVGSSWYWTYLLDFDNVRTNAFLVKNSSFSCITGGVLSFNNTPNVTVTTCSFSDCYREGVRSDIGSSNMTVSNCTFERIGLAFENTSAVCCQGENYHIYNNSFKDYGYCAINVGYGRTRRESQIVSGIIEDNAIVFSKDYIRAYQDNMLMDGGAIYVMQQNDLAVIRNNYIDGHSGMMDNRGIFLDDGAYNVEIYGNLIINIENSYCIDSRRVAGVETSGMRGENVKRSNVNNKIFDNIVDGRIRFAAREGNDNGCELGANFFLLTRGEKMPENDYFNIDATNKDVGIIYRGTKNNKIKIMSSDYKRIRNSSSWEALKKWIR